MEHQLFSEIVRVLGELDKSRFNPHQTITDADIVKTWFWAVIHDRPVSWACRRGNWPIHLRKQRLPSDSWMSRRLRTKSVRALLAAMEQRVIAPKEPGVFWMIDGKPLTISGCSKDRQAGYGRAAGGKAKGYKLHALVNQKDEVAAWRIAPMNVDERVMAARLIKAAPEQVQGYVVTDSNYDSNPLHTVCETRSAGHLQLVNRRRYGSNHGHGHRKQTSGRMRSKNLLENPKPDFGNQLLRQRSEIERAFAGLVNWGGGLTSLPAWVRTHQRVHRWVQAKLMLAALKREIAETSYVA